MATMVVCGAPAMARSPYDWIPDRDGRPPAPDHGGDPGRGDDPDPGEAPGGQRQGQAARAARSPAGAPVNRPDAPGAAFRRQGGHRQRRTRRRLLGPAGETLAAALVSVARGHPVHPRRLRGAAAAPQQATPGRDRASCSSAWRPGWRRAGTPTRSRWRFAEHGAHEGRGLPGRPAAQRTLTAPCRRKTASVRSVKFSPHSAPSHGQTISCRASGRVTPPARRECEQWR